MNPKSIALTRGTYSISEASMANGSRIDIILAKSTII
jgi:hypothetical protein